ncbi:unnamed protein product [Sympodiomycopsis kandeliae]
MATMEDPDLPPSFPMPGSAQIASGSNRANNASSPSSESNPSFTVSGPSKKASSSHSSSAALRSVLDSPPSTLSKKTNSTSSGSSLMPPPGTSSSSRPPPSSSSSLMPPPSTSRLTAPAGVGGAPSPQTLIPGETTSKRKKVVLAPGRSPLDWARVKASNNPMVLREGLPHPGAIGKIPLSEVKKHKNRESAWTVLNGMVYNMTPYLEFHPGGEKELMRVAGRDGTRLFMLTHSWVNIDAMIDGCCLGMCAMDQ